MSIRIYDVDNLDPFRYPTPKGVPVDLIPGVDEGTCVGLICTGVRIGDYLDVNDNGYDVGRFRHYTIIDAGDGTPPLYFCEDCICFLSDLASAIRLPKGA